MPTKILAHASAQPSRNVITAGSQALRGRQTAASIQTNVAWLPGMELLTAWSTRAGPIPPGTFVGWIEPMGLRQAFTGRIVRQALDGIKARMAGSAPFYLSVNVFPADPEDESFLEFLLASVEERGVAPERLVLEVTESAVFSTSCPEALFGRYREAGFRIFLDERFRRRCRFFSMP